MRKIYTGIDIGSYSIKMIVCEYINGKFQVLASTNVRSKGIQKGLIIDENEAAVSLEKAKKNIEEMLGININQAIVSVSSDGINFDIVSGKIAIDQKELISADQIMDVYKEAMIGKITDDREVITILPIFFQVDENEECKDPKGMQGNSLSVKAVITTIPKFFLLQVADLLKKVDIEVVDVGFSSLGDYYEARNREIDSGVVSIINIGYDTTEVSIFNKGIMIKDEKIDAGSKLIDIDIAKRYNLKRGVARYVKENFAISNTRYADSNDILEVTDRMDNKVILQQLELSDLVEGRIVEILKLAKKQINILTNREISYIIITGGISEMAGFQYVVENIFDRRASTFSIGTIGVRSNVYSSVLGLIKYFHYKLEFRGNSYSMFDEKTADRLNSTKGKVADVSDNIISKVFSYFS